MTSQRGPRFIISGAPASGKGTQCEFIKDKYKVVHLSTGDMLRAAVQAESEIGLKAKEYMDKGELVPDEVIIGVVIDRIQQKDCIEKGWLLDGFPRTRVQADALSNAGIACDVFIQLDVDDGMLVERVVGRRMDPITGKIFHLKYSPPPSDDEELMNRLVHRSDDTEEKIVVRIESYKKNLSSIIDKYATCMVRINGNSTPAAAWQDIRSHIEAKLRVANATKPRKAPRFIISGAPASGKGTQCEFIKKEFNVVHLSTGDMLRAAAEAQTPVGLEAKSFMDKGALVPDEIIIGVVIDRLDQADCKERGWLLDGFPRTRGQADALEKAGIECDVFIQLDVDENLLVERVVGRRMDPETGKIYHLKYSPPPEDVLPRLIHRSDDTEDKVKVRIQNYNNNLDSIIDKYAAKVIRIDGNRSPSLIWKEMRSRSIRALKFHVVFILGG
jgi:adenylate kinase